MLDLSFSLINEIGLFLEEYERGILNLIGKGFYNKQYKLGIESFILNNNEIRKWYCKNFSFDLNFFSN